MRKTKEIVIPGIRSEEQGQRDNGKRFVITEMPASKAEKWAQRAFLALAHSKLDLPSSKVKGMAWIEQVQHAAGHLYFPELEPLMDEMVGCIHLIDDAAGTPFPRPLMTDDIEEIDTLRLLRSEAITIHVGFLLPAAILNWIAAGSTMTEMPEDFEDTRTSRKRSARSSRRA